MKVKLKLGDIVISEGAIKNFSKEKLPVKLSWNLQKNIKVVFNEIQEFNKKVSDFIKEYGVKLENGNYSVDPKDTEEGYEKFLKDRNELLNTDTELDLILISLEELNEAKVILPAEDMLLYSYLIEEKKE